LKTLLRVAAAAVLLLLAAPEIRRYRGERRIGVATAMFQALVDRASEPQAAAELLQVGRIAQASTPDLPGDPRPWMIAGSAFLVTGQPGPALESYREAFATGERAEIDLNLGRAYVLGRRTENAEAALLRAGWISPEILGTLSPAVRDPLLDRIARLSAELGAGRLTEPPPLPPDERR
jgi:cytochrome c-type biogenesis protein CcmH/NrfG